MIRKLISHSTREAAKAAETLNEESSLQFIEDCAKMLSDCFLRGGKILIAGNGGSLCDASHFAEELTGQFRKKRKALAALSLSCPGHMSCVANDMGYDQVFSRGVEALGKEGDVFVALSTSGNSKNLSLALKTAKLKKMKTISFLGKTGGEMVGIGDLEWVVSGFAYSDRIQEAHMAAIHIIIEALEEILFFSPNPLYVSKAPL